MYNIDTNYKFIIINIIIIIKLNIILLNLI